MRKGTGTTEVMRSKHLAALAAAFLMAVPFAAQAQDVPSYSQGQPSYATSEENVHGRIVSFDGAYALQVRDDRGFVDSVQLHQGTIINPTGLTLQPGMVVSVLGYNSGSYLAANEIDTPYTYYGGVPWYGGHPWNYWGPTISLGFFFGNTGWWHPHGAYVGGEFRGRDYVAPRERGGYYPSARHDERRTEDRGHR